MKLSAAMRLHTKLQVASDFLGMVQTVFNFCWGLQAAVGQDSIIQFEGRCITVRLHVSI